ncbi:hypothetical protein Golomagni_02617 [Golovinomyces magnicellulatus]|nr:hypothetical protein Golomagni_02617 [Golovinomyces magnicellulatus]
MSVAQEKDKSKVHKLSLKVIASKLSNLCSGSSKLVAEFLCLDSEYLIDLLGNRFQRGVYPAEDFTAVKKYGLTMLVSSDDQVKAYIKKIMSQLDKWMIGGKISKLILVITSEDTGEHLERWQFDVHISQQKSGKKGYKNKIDQENEKSVSESLLPVSTFSVNNNLVLPDKTEAEIQSEIQSIFRQITASVTFLPELQGNCTFNILVYADMDSDVPIEWGDSDAKEIKNGEKVQLRSFSTSNHKVDTLVSYRLAD